MSELLEFLNEQLEQLQEQQGLFENFRFQNLVQLDDLSDIVVPEMVISAEEVPDDMEEEPAGKVGVQARTIEHQKSAKEETTLQSATKEEPQISSTSSAGMTTPFYTPVLVALGTWTAFLCG